VQEERIRIHEELVMEHQPYLVMRWLWLIICCEHGGCA